MGICSSKNKQQTPDRKLDTLGDHNDNILILNSQPDQEQYIYNNDEPRFILKKDIVQSKKIKKAFINSLKIDEVVKIIRKSHWNSCSLQSLKNFPKLDNENLVKIYEVSEDENHIFIAHQFVHGCSLKEKLQKAKRLHEAEVATVMRQTLQAIDYLHSNQLSHMSLELDKILLVGEHFRKVKITGFGFTNPQVPFGDNNSPYNTPISRHSLSLRNKSTKEILNWGIIKNQIFGPAVGEMPFTGTNEDKLQQNIRKAIIQQNSTNWDYISEKAKSLISDMLQYKESSNNDNIIKVLRPTAKVLLTNPWMQLGLKKYGGKLLPMQALQSIQQIQKCQKLQQATVDYVLHNMMTKQEQQETLKIFQKMDKNQDGQLSKEELIKGFSQRMNLQKATREVERFFENLDQDKSGTINYQEFVLATTNKEKALTEQRLNDTFALIDTDNSGHLSYSEIAVLLRGVQISEAEIKKLISDVDINNDGQISLDEFHNMMKKLTTPLQNNKPARNYGKYSEGGDSDKE